MSSEEAAEPEPDADVAALATALATLLSRRCLQASEPDDETRAHDLVRLLSDAAPPKELFALAFGAVWAGFGGIEDLDEDTTSRLVQVARLFFGDQADETLALLACQALVLLAQAGYSDQTAADLVRAGQGLWSSEHHDLAVRACRAALQIGSMSALDEATALIVIARITSARDDLDRVRLASRSWDEQVRARVDITSLLRPDEQADKKNWDDATDAVVRGDRVSAAAAMTRAVAALRSKSVLDHKFLAGLERGFDALAHDVVQVEQLRRGLVDIVRHLRSRQRFGNVPPAARSNLEMLILVLTCDQNEATASVLSELLEALADAGLSEVEFPAGKDIPDLAEAAMVEQAQLFPLWPDLQECVDGLSGNFGLLLRRIGGGRSSAERWISMFIVPPNGVLQRNGPVAAANVEVLDRLAQRSGPPGAVAQAELDSVVAGLLHSQAVDALAQAPTRGLVVVPDGPTWSLPWQAATLLRTRPTSLAPSLTVHARLPSLPRRIRSVGALLDDTVDGADLVLDELHAARESGTLDVDFSPACLDREHDLFLGLAHGGGDGLSFRIGIGRRGLSAYEMASRVRSKTAVIASCWSARTPPVALPLNLPVSLLLRGRSHCVGGAWPLPQRSTAQLLARVVRQMALGDGLVEALAAARSGSPNLTSDWGLVSVGAIPPWSGGA